METEFSPPDVWAECKGDANERLTDFMIRCARDAQRLDWIVLPAADYDVLAGEALKGRPAREGETLHFWGPLGGCEVKKGEAFACGLVRLGS